MALGRAELASLAAGDVVCINGPTCEPLLVQALGTWFDLWLRLGWREKW